MSFVNSDFFVIKIIFIFTYTICFLKLFFKIYNDISQLFLEIFNLSVTKNYHLNNILD